MRGAISSERFDRTNPVPPWYLDILRCRGGRRHWNASCRNAPYYSQALKELNGARLPAKRGVYLDAGCGLSPDAAMAVKFFKFESAVKIDLFDLWPGNPFYKKDESKLGGARVQFVKGDICKLTDLVPLESVDCIGCNAVVDLMSMADRHLFYNEALEVLSPGGTLIVFHVPLSAGHQDWVHARDEYKLLDPFGFSGCECIAAQKSLLVVKKLLRQEEPS